jgi:hypothetical protein
MIARVTDLAGRIAGAHCTWLGPDGFDSARLGKAPIDMPRRAIGDLVGSLFGVRIQFEQNQCLLMQSHFG